jgi:hypothetical protein
MVVAELFPPTATGLWRSGAGRGGVPPVRWPSWWRGGVADDMSRRPPCFGRAAVASGGMATSPLSSGVDLLLWWSGIGRCGRFKDRSDAPPGCWWGTDLLLHMTASTIGEVARCELAGWLILGRCSPRLVRRSPRRMIGAYFKVWWVVDNIGAQGVDGAQESGRLRWTPASCSRSLAVALGWTPWSSSLVSGVPCRFLGAPVVVAVLFILSSLVCCSGRAIKFV